MSGIIKMLTEKSILVNRRQSTDLYTSS